MEKLVFIVQQHVKSYMKRTAFSVLLVTLLPAFSACAALPDPPTPTPPPPTRTAPLPTPTIDWFPATETPTPQSVPTQGPTPERKPGVGKVLLTDNFTSGEPWNPGVSEDAGINVSRGRLTIA